MNLEHPRLAEGVRLRWDGVRDSHVLLFPEGALKLNSTALAVLELCDGERSLGEISKLLSERYGGADVRGDVESLLEAIASRGLVIGDDDD
jgi:pyrroloquinoline quinone biosynthesis protein D